MRTRNLLLAVLLLLLAGAGYAILGARQLPQTAQQAQTYWAQVEDEFRRRAEIVPKILASIEQINPNQTDLIAKVKASQAAVLALAPDPDAPRSLPRFRSFMQVQDGLSENLGLVMDMLRLYPDKARTEAIVKTFNALEEQESHIVVARSYYVQQAAQHNELLRRAPQSWVIAMTSPGATPLVASFETAQQ